MPQAGPPQQIPVGSLYGLPGFTETFEQYENINNFSTTLARDAQSPFNPPASFQKTDIVKWWEMEMFFTYSAAATTDGYTWSPYAPFNLLQNFKLKLQGQYSPLEVESGIDLAFWQMMRPMRGKGQQSIQTLAGALAQSQQWGAAVPAAVLYSTTVPTYTQPGINPNPLYGPSGSSNGQFSMFQPLVGSGPGSALEPAVGAAGTLAGTCPFVLELPAGIWLDQYWDLAVDGSLLPNASGVVQPVSAFVSPQYMGGGERVIVPQFNFSPIVGATMDQGPLVAINGAVEGATTGSVITNCRRVGVYSSENPAELPPVYNWQYRRSSKRFPLGAQSKIDIPITEYGQLFSVFVRIIDPTTNTYGPPYNTTGASTGVANQTNQGQYVTKCQLLYGSNLPKFDDDIVTMQQRFIYQHGFPPLNGMIVWDMLASGQDDLLTNNSRVLNTLTNANTHIHLEFISADAPGASAYAVVGTELLVPVSTQ
jgi:hypothetical protein